MAIQKTEAIVLRRQEIRETSLILVALTRDLGKIHGLVKGVRGSGAAVPWVLEPLTLQAVVLYERRRSSLSLVSHCDLLDPFDAIRRDLTRTAYACLALDLVEAVTERWDPHPEIFKLLLDTLRALTQGMCPRLSLTFMEAHLLRFSGIFPPLDSLPLSAGARLSLQQILKTSPDRMGRLGFHRSVEKEMRRTLQGIYRSVLDRELRSLNFLNAIGLEALNEVPAIEAA